MVKKVDTSGAAKNTDTQDTAGQETNSPLGGTVKESASQIWLAGLGAFSKAQEEGSKMFEALVKEGVAIQRKTQTAAEDKLSEATSKMASMATGISARASGQWDKLENIFEERVSKALGKLGVPLAADVDALSARVDELSRTISQLRAKAAAGSTARRTAPSRAATGDAPKPAARRTTPRKTM